MNPKDSYAYAAADAAMTLALFEELKKDFNRHVDRCPHGRSPRECGDPDCVVAHVIES